ncbi:MAG TPA: response regulator [Syntrophales bacterium]|nr:response regulator [Syntrophales bacterium]HOL59012.1 response regulator [Syntrophales bacterium]HPO34710.1 response regulator [Syntrophales bacterium]
MTGKKILVIEDEKDICDLIAFHLKREGFSVEQLYDGEMAWHRLQKNPPDLIVLDLMLPGMSGLELCRLLKGQKHTESIPIIMVTAKNEDADKVIGLELGADDYLTKPFNPRELVARVRAVLRRLRPREEGKKFFLDGELVIDYEAYAVYRNNELLDLSSTELKLLFFLTQHPNRVYSRDQLLDAVWGDETFVEPRTVDVHVSRLRAAIEEDKENPKRIQTVRGIGYKYVIQKE